MNREEFEEVESRLAWTPVTIEDLAGPDRTLIYGSISKDRHWHTYLQNDEIHYLVYDLKSGNPDNIIDYESGPEWLPFDLIPLQVKVMYPENTDKKLAHILANQHISPCYRNFDNDRYEKYKNLRFHGAILDARGNLVISNERINDND